MEYGIDTSTPTFGSYGGSCFSKMESTTYSRQTYGVTRIFSSGGIFSNQLHKYAQ